MLRIILAALPPLLGLTLRPSPPSPRCSAICSKSRRHQRLADGQVGPYSHRPGRSSPSTLAHSGHDVSSRTAARSTPSTSRPAGRANSTPTGNFKPIRMHKMWYFVQIRERADAVLDLLPRRLRHPWHHRHRSPGPDRIAWMQCASTPTTRKSSSTWSSQVGMKNTKITPDPQLRLAITEQDSRAGRRRLACPLGRR